MHEVQRRIARIAGRRDNVISRAQLLEAGLGRGAIAHRVATGDGSGCIGTFTYSVRRHRR